MTVKLVDNYFSDALKWTLLILSILVSSYLIFTDQYQWIVLLFLILLLISFSSKYILVVDTDKKVIIDSFSFLWIVIKSEAFNFNLLKCIRLDKQRHSYDASTRSRVRQTDFNEYIGTLEYDQDKSVELIRKTEYQSLAEEMQHISKQLNIPIQRTF